MPILQLQRLPQNPQGAKSKIYQMSWVWQGIIEINPL